MSQLLAKSTQLRALTALLANARKGIVTLLFVLAFHLPSRLSAMPSVSAT
ncbi:hypothetical protein [Pseudomonas sp. SO81]|nr:hypothetical protein [Pseudomonas sp. SO81]